MSQRRTLVLTLYKVTLWTPCQRPNHFSDLWSQGRSLSLPSIPLSRLTSACCGQVHKPPRIFGGHSDNG
jgi:hypothetical protein